MPILVTSDLKSGDEKFERRRDRRPTKYELYGSATLADIADTILLIYRDEIFNEACREPGVAEIIVDKSLLMRASIKLSFLNDLFRFENFKSLEESYCSVCTHCPPQSSWRKPMTVIAVCHRLGYEDCTLL